MNRLSNRLNIRSFIFILVTAVLSAGASSALAEQAQEAEEATPFPEVVHVENSENLVEELAESMLLLEQIGYNPDDAYLYRIHNDTYYHLVAFSDNGDVVQLHDGSKWAIHPSQRHAVLYWVQSDNVFIKPQSSCFSSYKFVLHNHTMQQSVEANLINPPLPMGVYTFRIINIEPYARLVILSDNTVWQVDATDSNFPYWQIGQRVVIGLNNHWRNSPLPNILINVDMYKEPYSQANFYGYPVGN